MIDLSNGMYESETSISLTGVLNDQGYLIDDTEIIIDKVQISNSKSFTLTMVLNGTLINGDVL